MYHLRKYLFILNLMATTRLKKVGLGLQMGGKVSDAKRKQVEEHFASLATSLGIKKSTLKRRRFTNLQNTVPINLNFQALRISHHLQSYVSLKDLNNL